jgi:hypothetical protein
MALGYRQSLSSGGFENIRIKAPLLALRFDLPCWNRNGMPLPSGVLGCHLCTATWQVGTSMSTVTIESCVARTSVAGTFSRSEPGIAYAFVACGLRKTVCKMQEM